MTPTSEQLAVIESDGDVYVRACPGAGKTRTLIDLAVRATEEAPRAGVAFLSFTNAAGGEVRDRLATRAPRLLRAPSFVGTFDAFLIRHVLGPDGLQRAPGIRVQFRETWDDRIGFALVKGGVSLDVFVPDGTALRIDAARAGRDYATRAALQRLDHGVRTKLCREAAHWIAGRLQQGIVTAPFLRSEAARRIAKSDAAARAAARFRLLLVDEAQDCDALDLQIVASLRSAGCRCVVVADPEQGIFRWRGADPAALNNLGLKMLPLTGNFRSRVSICAASASLRAVEGAPDVALGDHPGDSSVALITYEPRLSVDVGRAFERLLGARGIDAAQAIVIAHREDVARIAVGAHNAKASASAGAALARGVDSAASTADRDAAVDVVEQVLIRALGAATDNRPLVRWCNVTARQLIGCVAAASPDRGVCSRVKAALGSLRPPHGAAFLVAPKKLLTAREPKTGAAPGPSAAGVPLRFSTVHGVKGREFDAVLVVLPDTQLPELTEAWRTRDHSHEGRAVIYVAATRARHALAFAVPQDASAAIAELLRRHGAAVEEMSCSDLLGDAGVDGE